ncbi:MAG: leucine-rich repeat protein [Marinifilaceae bacterium]|jgi:hypothetical protein|nr:leucine-rich repeat protein [Marinifilaceae bacterium]
MKFNKLINLILVSLFILSCSNKKEKKETIEEIKTQVNLLSKDIDVSSKSASKKFEFYSNKAWKVEVSKTKASQWCSVYPEEGEAGKHVLTIDVNTNTTFDNRSVSVNISSKDIRKTFIVNQKQKDAIILSKDEYQIDKTGGNIELVVKSNIEYSAEISEGSKSWISEIKTKGLTNSILNFKIAKNEGSGKREGHISIKNSEISEIVTIYQIGEKTLLLSSNRKDISSAKQEFSLTVNSNTEYRKEINCTWIKELVNKGMSSHKLFYIAEENKTGSKREGKITFRDINNDIEETFTLIQDQKNSIIISTKEINAKAEGGNIETTISANVDYTIEIPEEAKEWISVIKTKGLSESKVQFIIKKNDTYDKRSAKVLFKSESISEILTINQNQKDELILSSKEINVKSEGENIETTISANVDYTIEIPEEAKEWISIIKTKGLSESKVQFIIKKNDTYKARSAKIIFKSGKLVDILTVNQNQKNALILSSKEINVDSEGGNIETSVNSNIDFTIEIPEEAKAWISAIKTKGLKETKIQFIVKQNETSDKREAKIVFKSGEITEILSIKQNQKDVLTLSTKEINAKEEGESVEIEVSSNIEYTIETPEDAKEWINVIKTKSINGNKVQIIIKKNESASKRSAKLIFKGKGIERILNINQDCSKILEILGKHDLVSLAKGELKTINIRANIEIAIDKPEWIISEIKGSGINKTINLSIKSNFGGDIRYGVILINSTTNPELKESIKIKQSGIDYNTNSYILNEDGSILKHWDGNEAEIDFNKDIRLSNIKEIGNKAFKNNKESHIRIVLPKGLIKINDNAFQLCENLEYVSIPESTDYIGEYAFNRCSKLKTIKLPENLKILDKEAFNGTGLEKITIPNSIITLGTGVFKYCNNLKEVIIEDGITYISSETFHSCSKLKSIIIPESVSKIDSDAFKSCTSLEEITIPNQIKEIKEGCFTMCKNLSKVILSENLTHIRDRAFYNCTKLENIKFPNRIMLIGVGAFENCSNIKSISLPKSLRFIDKQAFAKCINLSNIEFPEELRFINSGSFIGCTSLIEISLPKMIRGIGDYAFAKCINLKQVKSYIEDLTKIKIGKDIFNGTLKETLIVPASLHNEYSTKDPWKEFKNIIER